VVVAADSSFILAWAVGPFPYNIWAESFDSAGIPITDPYLVNTCTQGNQGRPCVAGAAGQNYLIVWDCDMLDGNGCCVHAQVCTPGGELAGNELSLSVAGLGRCWYPDAAMAADGRYVVVWVNEGQDGSGYGIFAETGSQQQ
jgi:hypothetical protein